LWKHLLTHFREIDFCVLGEGEYPFLNLIKAIEKGDQTGIEEISGIAFKRNDKIFRTEDVTPIENLDINTLLPPVGALETAPFVGPPGFGAII